MLLIHALIRPVRQIKIKILDSSFFFSLLSCRQIYKLGNKSLRKRISKALPAVYTCRSRNTNFTLLSKRNKMFTLVKNIR